MVLARFRDVRPQVAAACASAAEVAEAIALARRSGLGLAVRSGGSPAWARSRPPTTPTTVFRFPQSIAPAARVA